MGIGSIYVCSSSFMLRCLRRQSHRHHSVKPIVITHLVFALSMCDIMLNVWILIIWIPPTLFNQMQFYPVITCKIIGAFGQFFLVSSSCFYCVIIYITWTMMTATASCSNPNPQRRRSTFASVLKINKKSDYSNIPYQKMTDDNQSRYFPNTSSMEQKRAVLTEKLNKIVIRGSIFALITSTILTAVPFIDDGYGYVQNVSDAANDMFICWISNHFYQLSLYIPIAIYMIFALILTFFSLFRTRKVSKTTIDSKKKNKKWKLIQRLFAFTFIFMMTWICALLYWLWITISRHSNPPFILMVLHHLSFGCIGFGNSIVWLKSTSFQSCCKSLKQQYKNMNDTPRISERIKRLVTNSPEDEYGITYNQYITKLNEQKDSEVKNTKPQTYKLDRITVQNLNRHKRSFKTPKNSVTPNKTSLLNENSDIQMSEMSSPSMRNSKSIPLHSRMSTILSDVFASDDDELEFSMNSSQSRFSLS